MVLAEIDRALAGLAAAPHDQGLQLAETCERVLSGLLGLAGIVSENMVRDSGWYLLDTGRGLERALQLVNLLQATLVEERAQETDRMVVEAVMSAAESIVTFRRRYRGRTEIDAVVELLLVDQQNPRSLAYQLNRIEADLRAVPSASMTSRPLRLVEDLVESVRSADLSALVQSSSGRRPVLHEFLDGLGRQLTSLADAINQLYLQQPPSPQPLWRSSSSSGALS
jgi:uncharacterized alpha-E superfamily protein